MTSTSWIARRARAGWLLGIALLFAGFLPVVLFVVGSLLPAADAAPALSLYPEIPPEWASKAERWLKVRRIHWRPGPEHAGLAFAALGFLAMLLGAAIAKHQAPRIEAARRQRQDALRRAQQYRQDGRAEPTFAADLSDAGSEPPGSGRSPR